MGEETSKFYGERSFYTAPVGGYDSTTMAALSKAVIFASRGSRCFKIKIDNLKQSLIIYKKVR
ncbi:hypothetical protein OCE16_22960 [Bacillus toyonensis]|nr:hypothetical protein [Bacillus toyonensis]